MQFLKEAVPAAKRIALLATQLEARPAAAPILSKYREYAAKLGMSLIEVLLPDVTPQEIERGFAEMARRRANAMTLSPEGAFFHEAQLIVRPAEKNRLPAIYPYPLYQVSLIGTHTAVIAICGLDPRGSNLGAHSEPQSGLLRRSAPRNDRGTWVLIIGIWYYKCA